MDGSDVIALIALIVAAIALALQLIQWFGTYAASRRADVQARYEAYEVSGQSMFRLVIRNYGPAIAHNVHVDLDDAIRALIPGFEEMVPIPVLHGRQDFHLPVVLGLGDNPPSKVTIRWRDNKDRCASTYVAVHDVLS